jgi:FtsZ-binding cell division protein ZapB
MISIDQEIKETESAFENWKPQDVKIYEKGHAYIKTNRELRDKISQLIDSIELVMIKSTELNKEKHHSEPTDSNLKSKRDQLEKLQKQIQRQQKSRHKL